MDRRPLDDSKQGGRHARSPCRIIHQAIAGWLQAPPLPAKLPPPVTPSSCRCSSRRMPCGDDGDDAWGSRPVTIPRRARPCSPLLRATRPAPKLASPTLRRRKLRKELKGCASYSWISLISGSLMDRNVTIKGIAIPVPSGSQQDPHERLRPFCRPELCPMTQSV